MHHGLQERILMGGFLLQIRKNSDLNVMNVPMISIVRSWESVEVRWASGVTELQRARSRGEGRQCLWVGGGMCIAPPPACTGR